MKSHRHDITTPIWFFGLIVTTWLLIPWTPHPHHDQRENTWNLDIASACWAPIYGKFWYDSLPLFQRPFQILQPDAPVGTRLCPLFFAQAVWTKCHEGRTPPCITFCCMTFQKELQLEINFAECQEIDLTWASAQAARSWMFQNSLLTNGQWLVIKHPQSLLTKLVHFIWEPTVVIQKR